MIAKGAVSCELKNGGNKGMNKLPKMVETTSILSMDEKGTIHLGYDSQAYEQATLVWRAPTPGLWLTRT